MSLSKTTFTFAQKRKLDITESLAGEMPAIWIWQLDEEDEPMIIYSELEDGTGWTLHAAFDIPQELKDELPYWITDEVHLRQVLAFISKELG